MSRDFSKYPALKWEDLEVGMDFAVEQILRALPEFTDIRPVWMAFISLWII